MTTFPEYLDSARRVEYLLYVHGMPWAVATSEDAIRALDGTVYRTAMLGAETYGSGLTLAYFADCVDIYPLLQVPGPQDIRNEDAMSSLEGGTWTAQISDDPIHPSLWVHSARASILGLEGVHAIASPQIDSSIKTARLYEPCPRDHFTVKWTDDPGDLLYTAATSASVDHPLVVWLGQECMSISGASKTSGVVTATIEKRGILETSDYYHATNKITSGAPPIRISDAPLWGVQNRPYTLFALVCEGEGASCQVVSYGRVRHGKVSGDVSYKTGMWSMEMLPWWKWLDTELQVDKIQARLDKFVLTRPFWTVDQTNCDICGAHVVFREWVESTTTMSDYTEIWLCDAGESVVYDTLEDLELALTAAMTVASPNSWVYLPGEFGPVCTSTLADDDRVYIDGSILLQIGWHTSRSGPYDSVGNPYGWSTACTSGETYAGLTAEERIAWSVRDQSVHKSSAGPDYTWGQSAVKTLMYRDYATDPEWSTGDGWFFNVVLDHNTSAYHAYLEDKGLHRIKPDYVISWGWEDTPASEQHTAPPRKDFAIPIDRVSGEARVWISTDSDVTNVGGGTVVQLGDYSCQWDTSNNTLANFISSSAGIGGVDDNYLVATTTDADYLTSAGNPAIIGSSMAGTAEKFRRGSVIWGGHISEWSAYDPETGWGLTDPWPVVQSYDITLPKIGDIYRALMGTGSYADEVAQEIQVDHIPMPQTLDSAQLDTMIDSSSLPFDVRYVLRYSGAINLWKVLLNEIQFHGLTMVYQWDDTYSQYVIRFRKFGTTSATVAMLTGKHVDSSIIDSQTKTSVEHSTNWQINAAEISVNYDPELKDYLYRFDISDASGYEPTGGKINKLVIEPTITWVKNLDHADVQAALIAWLSAMYEGTSYPRPSLKFDAVSTDMCALSVGSDTLVTIDGIHNPFSGAIGLSESSAWIVGQTIDPSTSKVKYELSVSPREVHGWSPTCWIIDTLPDEVPVPVMDIGGNGREFCNYGNTLGWYDHWFFGDIVYNESMTSAVSVTSSTYMCRLVEKDSKNPVVLYNIEVTNVNPKTYAQVKAVAEPFFYMLVADPSWTGDKQWYLIFDAFDQSGVVDNQRNYMYIADDDLLLKNPDSSSRPGKTWV